METSFNKVLYVGFLVLGLYQVFFGNDYLQAAATLGIGLAFDPFDAQQKWNERPVWQKTVLLLNVALVFSMFGLAIWISSR